MGLLFAYYLDFSIRTCNFTVFESWTDNSRTCNEVLAKNFEFAKQIGWANLQLQLHFATICAILLITENEE